MIKIANKYLLGFSPEKSAQVAKLVGKAGFVEVIENQENNQNKSDLAKKLDAVLQSLEYKIASFDFLYFFYNFHFLFFLISFCS